jgi:hypothetical protein
MMNMHFAAAVPNLRIMEIDIDRLPWDEEVFTAVPEFEQGHLIVPLRLAVESNRTRRLFVHTRQKGPGGLQHYRQFWAARSARGHICSRCSLLSNWQFTD